MRTTVTREALASALAIHDGNIKRAANDLHIHYYHVRRLCGLYGLSVTWAGEVDVKSPKARGSELHRWIFNHGLRVWLQSRRARRPWTPPGGRPFA
jgi:hypothetical protein